MFIQGSRMAGKPLNSMGVQHQTRPVLQGGGPASPNVRNFYRDYAGLQAASLKNRMTVPVYDVANRIDRHNKALTQHINLMENNMQKKASYKEVYQLYKKAGWWDNVKSDLGQAWDSFNSYADKNQWVRPSLYGAGGALGGYGLGSFFKNPLLRVLFAILGGAGGALGGLTHNQNRPYYNVNDTPQDPLSTEAAQGAVEQQKADQQAANEAAMKAQAAKPVAEKPAAKAVKSKQNKASDVEPQSNHWTAEDYQRLGNS